MLHRPCRATLPLGRFGSSLKMVGSTTTRTAGRQRVRSIRPSRQIGLRQPASSHKNATLRASISGALHSLVHLRHSPRQRRVLREHCNPWVWRQFSDASLGFGSSLERARAIHSWCERLEGADLRHHSLVIHVVTL